MDDQPDDTQAEPIARIIFDLFHDERVSDATPGQCWEAVLAAKPERYPAVAAFRSALFEGARAIIKTRPSCYSCSYSFDPSDPRGYVDRTPDTMYGDCSQCPACSIERRGAGMWAVKNDCNGLFDETVTVWKADAEALLSADDYGGGYVVPVRVIEEPYSRHFYREAAEREKEQWHGRPTAAEPKAKPA